MVTSNLKAHMDMVLDLYKLSAVAGLDDEGRDKAVTGALSTCPAICSLILEGRITMQQAKELLNRNEKMVQLLTAVTSESSRQRAFDKAKL